MTDQWDDPYKCPICHSDECVPPTGKKGAKILIVGEAPGRDEIKRGKPFCGATGEVLRKELAKVGIDIHSVRMCNIWHHAPNGNEECLQYGFAQVVKEARDKDVVLLIGSDTVKRFCHVKVTDVTGMEVKSPYLSAPLVMACVQPANVFNNVIGDLRLSLQKFAQKAEKYL